MRILQILLLCSSFAVVSPVSGADTIDQKINVALNLYQADAFTEAITVLDGVLSSTTTATPIQIASAHTVRGDCHMRLGKLDAAYTEYTAAIAVQEGVTDGTKYLIQILRVRASVADKTARFKTAIGDYSRILELDPTNGTAANGLAWLLATCPDNSFHDGILAVHYATRAATLSKFDAPNDLDTLAAAFARAGRYDRAVHYQEAAMGHPQFLKQVPSDSVKSFAQRLALYRDRKPYINPSPTAE